MEVDEDTELGMFSILTVTEDDGDLYKETFRVANIDLEMEIDTGAARSVMPYAAYREKFSHLPLQSSKVKLKAYNGGRIPVLGQISVQVTY